MVYVTFLQWQQETFLLEVTKRCWSKRYMIFCMLIYVNEIVLYEARWKAKNFLVETCQSRNPEWWFIFCESLGSDEGTNLRFMGAFFKSSDSRSVSVMHTCMFMRPSAADHMQNSENRSRRHRPRRTYFLENNRDLCFTLRVVNGNVFSLYRLF